MKFRSVVSVRLLSAILLSCCLISNARGQDKEPPAEAFAIQSTAQNLQQAGEFDLAREQWQKLVDGYGDTNLVELWRFNAGVCCVKTNQFQKAITTFAKNIEAVEAGKKFSEIDKAFLYKGYSEFSLGRSLIEREPESETAKNWLLRSAKTFADMAGKYPKSAFLDQAYYFQGEAYVAAEQLEKALGSYNALIDGFPKSKYMSDGLYAKGATLEDLGRYDDAASAYDEYLEKAPQGSAVLDVKFRKAETLLQIGVARDRAGARKEAVDHYRDARKLYDSVAGEQGFVNAVLAQFQSADCLERIGVYKEAALAFADFATKHADSELAGDAKLAAGRLYLREGDLENAVRWLEPLVREPGRRYDEVAHWLCKTYLDGREFQKAFAFAEQALKTVADDSRYRPSLMMHRGDAAYNDPNQRGKSAELYLELFNQFPKDRLAPQALYNAAFSFLQNKEPKRAIELAKRFESDFPKDTFAADIMDVAAEAYLQMADYANAAKTYQSLLDTFPDRKTRENWQVGLVQCLNLQEKYQESINLAESVEAEIKNPRMAAELHFHAGNAHFQLNQFGEAKTALDKSRRADTKWFRADEALLLCARCLSKQGDSASALTMANTCLEQYPKSRIRDQILYRVGEFAFADGKFKQAESAYDRVVALKSSQYVPVALYGKAWSQLKQDEFESAAATFTRMIDQFGDHAMHADAIVGRGMSHRKASKFKKAIEDFDTYLKGELTSSERASALYERGLAEVALKDNTAAAATFSQALDANPQSQLGDKIVYEMAWAYKNSDQSKKAQAAFARLAKDFAQSPLAVEARFHVATYLYNDKEYAAASNEFKTVRDAATDKTIAAKANYMLAWSYYKQKDFSAAEREFRNQATEYPKGPKYADALFMISESLYKQQDHAKAIVAYKVAIPEVQASSEVTAATKELAYLHGAQSANQTQDYATAEKYSKAIIDDTPDSKYINSAWFEYGKALKGQNKTEEALNAWNRVKDSVDRTGAQARFMVGEVLFEQRKFDEAAKEFKLVVYGYGGLQAHDEIKAIQAMAAYEAGRCNLVQISTADSRSKADLISESRKWFEYLVKNFPKHRLASDAETQLTKLKSL